MTWRVKDDSVKHCRDMWLRRTTTDECVFLVKNSNSTKRISSMSDAKQESSTNGKPGKAMTVAPLDMREIEFEMVGTSPLVINKFSGKAHQMMKDKQEQGEKSKKGRKRDAKDFQACFEAAKRIALEGWYGLHAGGLRNALISACRTAGFTMTRAKLSIFVVADGYDKDDGMPLVKLKCKEPEYTEMAVRNETGVVDLRARPMWREWGFNLRVRYDADQFSAEDVTNLVHRAGQQVGVGEGRPDSKKSAGMGWGMFTFKKHAEEVA